MVDCILLIQLTVRNPDHARSALS